MMFDVQGWPGGHHLLYMVKISTVRTYVLFKGVNPQPVISTLNLSVNPSLTPGVL